MKALRQMLQLLRGPLLAVHLEGYYVFETDLETFKAAAAPSAGVRIAKIPGDELTVEDLIPLWSDNLGPAAPGVDKARRSIQRHLDRGDECFCALVDGEVAGMLWVGYGGNFMLQRMAARDGLAPGEAIIHRGFVKEAHRGRKLHLALNEAIFLYLRQKGFRRIRRYVGINNIASVINNSRMNDRCRTLYHVEAVLAGRTFNFFPGYHTRCIPLKRTSPPGRAR